MYNIVYTMANKKKRNLRSADAKKTAEGGDESPPPPKDHESETEGTETETDKKSRKDRRGKAPKSKTGAVDTSDSVGVTGAAGTSHSVSGTGPVSTSDSVGGGPPEDGDDSDASHHGDKSAADVGKSAAKPHKKERAENVLILQPAELEIFQWLETRPQIWSNERQYKNTSRAEKIKLFQEIAQKYGKTGQLF